MPDKKEVASVADKPSFKLPLLEYDPRSQPLLMVKNISKSYKRKLILKDVNFEIFHGDIFGVIGMSGSGKTTLFQLMAGIMRPESGDVVVKSDVLLESRGKNSPDYISVFNNQGGVKHNFGFASQLPSFYEHLTVEENLHLYGSLYGLKPRRIKENTDKLMRLVELTSERDTIASELSGGMQRRLDIACSLIHEPKVLFLDEPTSDLDPVMRKQIWSLIKEISGKGTTIVLASHILEEVESLCTKVAILHDRRVLGYGTLKDLKRLFKRDRQVKVGLEHGRYDDIMKRLGREKGIIRMVQKDNRLVVFVQPDDKATRAVIKAVESSKDRLIDLEVADATLTEIFEALTKRAGGLP
jgi:linearmycin/streptolysin S transport system ATP-binding protein